MSGIDDIFKNGLQDSGLEYKEAYWNDMQLMLDGKKKRRKGGFFFFTSIGMLLLVVLIGYMLFHEEGKAPHKVKPDETATAMATPLRSNSEHTSADGKEVTVSSSDHPVVSQSHNPVPFKYPHQTSNISSSNDYGNELSSTNTNEISNTIEPIGSAATVLPSQVVTEDVEVPRFYRFIPVPVNLNKNFDLSIIDLKPFATATVRKHDPLPPPKTAWSYFMSAGYEHDQYSRAANPSLLKNEERTLNSSGFNLNFAAGKNRWRIRSGLGFLQLSELTGYTSYQSSYAYDTSYRMIDPDYGQTPAGTRIALIRQQVDSTVTNTPVILHPDSRVQFSYIKIPLIASYEFGFRRFGFTVDAGINTSFLVGAKGSYTVYDGAEYRVKEMNKNHDLSKTLLQTYAAAGLRYHFNKQISICGGYGWSHSLNSMTKSYMQKPRINLLTLGIEFKLN